MPAEARSPHAARRDADSKSTKAYTQPPHSPIQHSTTSKHIHKSGMSHTVSIPACTCLRQTASTTHIVPSSPPRWRPVLSVVQLHRGGSWPLHRTAASTPGPVHTSQCMHSHCTSAFSVTIPATASHHNISAPCTDVTDAQHDTHTCYPQHIYSDSTLSRSLRQSLRLSTPLTPAKSSGAPRSKHASTMSRCP